MIVEVRRVLMDEDAGRASGSTHVEMVEPAKIQQTRVWHIWGWDRSPRLPHASAVPYTVRSWSPPAGGMRISATRFSARQAARTDDDRAAEATLQALALAEPCGRIDDPAVPGMHRTDSIEIGVVVSGEVVVEAASGEQVSLRAGDVYVQNGAMHRWRPDRQVPAHVVFVSFGAERTR